MAGLYDGIDPQTALLLGLGSGLLGTVGQGRRAGFGEALSAGMQQGTAGYRQAIADRQRAEQMRMEQAAREQQMMLARQQMALSQNQDARAQGEYARQQQEHELQRQIQGLGARFMQTPEQQAMAQYGGPTNAAAEAAPNMKPRMDTEGLTNALMGLDWQKGMAFQSALKSANAPIKVGADDRLIDPRTNQVLLDAAGKPTDAARKYDELRAKMPWLSHDQAVQLSYDTITTSTPADGGVAVTSKFAQVGAMRPGGMQSGAQPGMQGGAPPMAQVGSQPSPYQPSPPAPGQIGGNPGSKPVERLNTDVKGFAGELEKANIPQLERALTTVEGMLSKIPKGGDVPGYGRTGMLPNAMLSDEGKQIRMALAPLANLTLKDRSGAAVTNPEMARFLAELGTGAFMTDQDMMRGVANLRSMLDATKSNFMAGAHPEVIGEYNRRYGANTQMPLGAGAAPGAQPAGNQPAAPGQPQSGPAQSSNQLKTLSKADVDATVRGSFARGKSRAEAIKALQDAGYAIPF